IELRAVPPVALDLQAQPELAVGEKAQRHGLHRPDVGHHRRLPHEVHARHVRHQSQRTRVANPGALHDDAPAAGGSELEAQRRALPRGAPPELRLEAAGPRDRPPPSPAPAGRTPPTPSAPPLPPRRYTACPAWRASPSLPLSSARS